MGSYISPTRDGTCTLCIGSNHWTTREIPGVFIPRACVLSGFSLLQFFVTHWTAAHQALLSIGFFRQEYWNGLLCPPPGDLPNPGVKPESLISPALAGGFFTVSTTWEAHLYYKGQQMLPNRTPMPPTPLHHHLPKSRSRAHTCLSQSSPSNPLSSLRNGCTDNKYRLL